MRLVELGVVLQRLFERRDGAVELAAGRERHAEVVVRLGQLRVGLHRFEVFAQRTLPIVLKRQRVADIEIDDRALAIEDLRLLLAYTGAPADSRALVGEVLEFARGNPSRYRARCGAISAARDALRDALEAAARSGSQEPREAALDAVRRAAAAMGALGDEAKVAIVTPELSRA